MIEITERKMGVLLNESFKEALNEFLPGRFSSADDSNMALSLLQVFYFSTQRRLEEIATTKIENEHK